jgi:hypothetical protein
MIVTKLTRARLRYERERRRMAKAGYTYSEPVWQLRQELETTIVDVVISEDRKGVWTKTSNPRHYTPCNAIKDFQCCHLQKYHKGEHETEQEFWRFA